MKKEINRILLLGSIFVFLNACVGSDDSNDILDPEEVTYEADVRPILESICLNCHTDPPINGAPMPLTTFDAVRNAVENRGLLTRINSISNPMPPSGLLPETSREIFQEWVDQGFIEN